MNKKYYKDRRINCWLMVATNLTKPEITALCIQFSGNKQVDKPANKHV